MDARTLGNLSVHPMTADDEKNACVDGWGSTGITLRQHFAGLAMQGMAMRATVLLDQEVARASVSLADALLAELAKDLT